jgi:hypothetical protein
MLNEKYLSIFLTNKNSSDSHTYKEIHLEDKPIINDLKKYFFHKKTSYHLKQRKKSLDVNEEKLQKFLTRQDIFTNKIKKNVEKMRIDKFNKDTNYQNYKHEKKSLNEIINHLYYKGINKKQIKKSQLLKKFNTSSNCIKNKNLESERLINNMKSKMCEKIFNVLDSDKDGYISPLSIQKSIKDIPNHMMKLLLPIFNKFNKENMTLSKEEFIPLLYYVYDNLDFDEKKSFVREYGDNSRLRELVKFNEDENYSKNFYFNPKINLNSKIIYNRKYRPKSINKSMN